MNTLVESYLHNLQEYEEVVMIDYCKSIKCPKKRLICLKLARVLLAPNLVAQHKVDREIDVLTNNYEGSGEIGDTFLGEAGFKHYPKGWTGKSVKKFSSSLVKGGAKPKGFFEKCVEKMRGKVDNPEGFCAAAKDEVYKSTGWRGKDKTPAEVAKAIKKKQFKLNK